MAVGVAIAGLVVSVVGAVTARRRQKRATKKQEEAQEVQTAVERARDTETRRQRAREERVKRAQVRQAAENLGVTGSSGAAGAGSSISTQQGTASSFAQGQLSGFESISNLLQRSGELRQSAADIRTTSDVVQQGVRAVGPSVVKLFSTGAEQEK